MGYSLFNTSLNSMGYPPAFGCQIHREGRRVLHGQPDRKDTRSRGRQNHECCGITNALSDRSSANSILFAPLCCLRALASTRVLDVGVKRLSVETRAGKWRLSFGEGGWGRNPGKIYFILTNPPLDRINNLLTIYLAYDAAESRVLWNHERPQRPQQCK